MSDGERSPFWRWMSRSARLVFGIVGVAFIIHTLWVNWPTLEDARFKTTTLAMAFAVLLTPPVLLSSAWLALIPSGDRTRPGLRGLFLTSLLAKYIPIGVGQPMAQILYGARFQVSGRQFATLFMQHSIVQALAASVVGAPALIGVGLPRFWFLVITLLGLILTAMALVGERILPWMSILVVGASTEARVISFGWSLLGVVVYGIGFSLTLGAVGVQSQVSNVAGYAAAWLVGFLAIPFPAGVGIREAALLTLVPVNPGILVAASVLHRIIVLCGEVTVAVLYRARRGFVSQGDEDA